MINLFRKILPERSPLRLLYHRFTAIIAATIHGFPAKKLTMIGVTGTSGKSSTVELIYHILQQGNGNAGSISGVQFHIGDKTYPNHTLRTTLRPWTAQKLLRAMVNQGITTCVMEVSSHAIDQNRIWGIPFDTVVLTNISDNEHIDYHENFADYVKTKARLFESVNTSYRKPNTNKTIILNQDSEQFDIFDTYQCDEKWTFSIRKQSTFRPENIQYTTKDTQFDLRVPNNELSIKTPLIGRHNLENIMAAIATAQSHNVAYENIQKALETFPGIPGRLEAVNGGQSFALLVDFSYKPSALKAIMGTLKEATEGRLIIVWGGAGGRQESNWQECAQILHQEVDEIILTTDDPYDVDPKHIAKIIRTEIKREEGKDFFEIEDRYEAIRYALFTAQPNDTVIIAGRGHETTQTIGDTKITFDDREVCREILALAHERNVL